MLIGSIPRLVFVKDAFDNKFRFSINLINLLELQELFWNIDNVEAKLIRFYNFRTDSDICSTFNSYSVYEITDQHLISTLSTIPQFLVEVA